VLIPGDPLHRLLDTVREAFGLTAVAVVERGEDGQWVTTVCAGPLDCQRPEDADVDVELEPDIHLVGTGRSLPAADRGLLETAGGQALLVLRNQRVGAAAAAAERRAESAAVPTPLLAAIGHDLRSPLTSIKAAVTSLGDPQLNLSETDRAELAVAIEESTDRLIGLIDNLLDSSRLAAGAVSPRLAPVGYEEVAAHAVAALPESRAVHVDIDVDEFLPEVLADAVLLERVVANVVDNALRRGGASVAIRAKALADRVELRVVDSGAGVSAASRAALFTPSRRLGKRGTAGLGLGVARGFAEAMGGTIAAEDTPGGGLTVVIALPAARRVTQVPR
jgi:two-component system sensor histidine kinase KdpD